MSVGPARTAILIGLIVAGTLLAYAPAMRAGFLWDDDDHVTENVALRSLGGLARIWLEPGATPQYYPLVHTSFWIEYHLWGTSPLGYHLVNVLLHVTVALLFGLALSRLSVPGAWWAAAFFALHPVHVETVAWITERKNLLSALFYLLALLAWLRGHPIGENKPLAGGGTASSSAHPGSWILAFVFFLASLLTKTVTASFPVAILLLHWWKEGRIGRRLLASLAPFFVAGFLLGLQTVSIERRIVGAQGEEWNLSPLARTAIAGRALWFYLAKLIAPVRLSFIYPRWDVESLRWIATLAPLAFAATIAALWFLRRRIGRGPLVACLFFAGTLFPALGFFDVYPFRYSFVADHFQYHASLGAIAFAAAALTLLA
ncbi:MAG: O-GlcNAc transferase, partial [Candidatus Eisenbacteria bacterium]|nr:O-GlcNAc transferase [Candidatus Eisenbacteria bacterium]